MPASSKPDFESSSDSELLKSARDGDESALTTIFSRYRTRLRRMIELRMNPRLQGRLDASDVVQDTLVEATRTLENYLDEPKLPVYFWLRQLASEKLIAAHRRHLGASKRDASRDLSLHGAALNATSEAVAIELVSQMLSPSEMMDRKQRSMQLKTALQKMDPIDREILTLKHFEQLTNREVARLLDIKYEAVKKRYFRALEKLERLLRSPTVKVDKKT